MYRQKLYDGTCMCEYGEYDEGQFVCRMKGDICKLTAPNKYNCLGYSKNKNNKGDSNYGTINGSGNVDL